MNARTGPTSHFNIQAQTACETEMLHEIDAREVFSGKAYEVLTEIAPASDRAAIPHIYIFPGSGLYRRQQGCRRARQDPGRSAGD